jgi:hypothetical protein
MLAFRTFLSILCSCSLVSCSGDYLTCCTRAVRDRAYLNKTIAPSDYKCGQVYSPNISPAPNLEVTYGWCKSNCGGWGEKAPSVPAEKLAPLLQYTLPAVVFSMTVPRRLKIEIPSKLFNFQINTVSGLLLRLPVSLLSGAIIVILDTIIWVILIFSLAGPMLFGGLHEALVDYRIITRLDEVEDNRLVLQPNVSLERFAALRKKVAEEKIQIISALISGNLNQDIGDPRLSMKRILVDDLNVDKVEHTVVRLMGMMSSQPSFGSAVGGAVLFYVGSFIYNILDIQNKKGDTDTADGLAFGVWWMTIVHVSIVAGCSFASNNPNTAATLVGLPLNAEEGATNPPRPFTLGKKLYKFRDFFFKPVYPSVFQPVWMWQRGEQKMRWIRDTARPNFIRQVKLQHGALAALFSITIFLVFLPAFLAFIVEYLSPKVGLGCRSLTVLVYFCCQVELVIVQLLLTVRPTGLKGYTWNAKGLVSVWDWTWLVTMWVLALPTIAACCGAVFVTLGGTLMEIIGVYQSCICGISATAWFTADMENAVLFLASDTAGFRASARLWGWCGYAAVGFISGMCYVGYWYQRYLREKFADGVRGVKQYFVVQTTTAP